MKNAIILHGRPKEEEYYSATFPSASNSHWLPWLQNQLQIHDIPAATPEVPYPFRFDWSGWQREVERFDIGPETLLIGHSTGAGFWVKYLSLHPELTVGRVVLVAPWIGTGNRESGSFFNDVEIDPNLAARTGGLTVFNSDDDMEIIQSTVAVLRDRIKGLQYREFHNYGHFCYKDMKTFEFPELLEELLA